MVISHDRQVGVVLKQYWRLVRVCYVRRGMEIILCGTKKFTEARNVEQVGHIEYRHGESKVTTNLNTVASERSP